MIGLFITMLVVHWFADYILQTHEQATNKASSWDYLLQHTLVYAIVWIPVVGIHTAYIGGTFEVSILTGLAFSVITCIVHTLTDYITSREVKKFFDKKDFHNGFVVIGLDQILHYVQLILTYLFLFQDGLRINI